MELPLYLAIAELISYKQNSRKRQPHTTAFQLSDSRKEFCKRRGEREADNTLHACYWPLTPKLKSNC